jgi:hypothetical protein
VLQKERALKSQVCSSNGQERYFTRDGCVFIAHTPKTSRCEDSAHLAVRPQFNSHLDCHSCNDYFQFKILTVGGAGGQTVNNIEAGGLTNHLWQSDHPSGANQTAKGSLDALERFSVEGKISETPSFFKDNKSSQ